MKTARRPRGMAMVVVLSMVVVLGAIVAFAIIESRIADPEVLGRVPLSINVDHHHDNTRFGRINLVVADASSTGEVLRDLFRELEIELTPDIAEALYIALVTDTGRFQYTNTTPKALRLAAELVEAGAKSHLAPWDAFWGMRYAILRDPDGNEVALYASLPQSGD